MRILPLAALGIFICAMAAQAAPASPPAYTVTVIPLLPGYNVMSPTALNNAGDVVGVASNTTDSPAPHTFLYHGGKVRDLGALGTPIAINAFGAILTSGSLYYGGHLVASAPVGSSFTALNDIGQTVGSGNVGSGDDNSFQPKSGFLRQPNGTIVPLTFQGSAVCPVAINDVGQIVADYTTPNNLSGPAAQTGVLHRTVLFRAGGKNGVDLGTLGFWTFAGGINVWGQVVGNSQILDNSDEEFVYEAPVEAVSYLGGTLTGLESLFGLYAVGEATAINDFGTIVGTAADIFDQGFTAAIYSGGVWYNLAEFTTGLPIPFY
jgi:probable HAF family extracellular repeat protein